MRQLGAIISEVAFGARQAAQIRALKKRCDPNSGIEMLFLLALGRAANNVGWLLAEEFEGTDSVIKCSPQHPIGRYRVDFLLTYSFYGSVIWQVVECDGHEWHEKTKSQAARDKRRTRALTNLGFPPLPFTGSEIFNSPEQCAASALEPFLKFQTSCLENSCRDVMRASA